MIKKAHNRSGSTLIDKRHHEPLDSDTIEWMASRVKEFPGYRFYNIGNALTFVTAKLNYPGEKCNENFKQPSTALNSDILFSDFEALKGESFIYSSTASFDCKSRQTYDDDDAKASSQADDDATFIVGHNKKHITTNRAVLAATNPVLKRMLYGVGHIKTDPTVPIVWSEFDAEVVQAVFDTLQNKKDSILVESSKVSGADVFLDFIGETDQIDVCRSDIGFEQCRFQEFFVRRDSSQDEKTNGDFVYYDY